MTTIDALLAHGIPLAVFFGFIAMVLGLLHLAGRAELAREETRARQIMLTDAIHSKLGAVVAPVVTRRRGGWDVSIAVPLARPALVAEVLSIVREDLASRRGGDTRIVLTERAPDLERSWSGVTAHRIHSTPAWRPAAQAAGAGARGAAHVHE